MRISDWSSDVCSSDLRDRVDAAGVERGDDRFGTDIAEEGDLAPLAFRQRMFAAAEQYVGLDAQRRQFPHAVLGRLGLQLARRRDKIGRASCRERVCQYV